MMEVVLGGAVAAALVGTAYMVEKRGLKFSFPQIGSSVNKLLRIGGNKEREVEKMREIDEKLEEAVNAGAEVSDVLESASKKAELTEDILEDIPSADKVGIVDDVEEGSEVTPEVSELPELPEDSVEVDTEEIDRGFALFDEEGEKGGETEENEGEDDEKMEFDDEDELISSIVKEIQIQEEVEIDLLRDLRGQKFDINELEEELRDVLQKIKSGRGD